MKAVRNYFKDWNGFELFLLTFSIVAIALSGVISKSPLLTSITSFLGILVALCQAKGKVVSQFIGVIESLLYSYLSFQSKFYGEVIIYLCLLLPLYIAGIYSWMKHKKVDSDTVETNTIGKTEWIILLVLGFIGAIGLYILLGYFDTEQLLVSTLSMVTSLFGTYLIVRRSKFSFLFYIMNDILLLILWASPIFVGNYLLLPMLVEPIAMFMNDIYGWHRWNIESKKLDEKKVQ